MMSTASVPPQKHRVDSIWWIPDLGLGNPKSHFGFSELDALGYDRNLIPKARERKLNTPERKMTTNPFAVAFLSPLY